MESAAVRILALLGLAAVAVFLALLCARPLAAVLDGALKKWRWLGIVPRVVAVLMAAVATVEVQKSGMGDSNRVERVDRVDGGGGDFSRKEHKESVWVNGEELKLGVEQRTDKPSAVQLGPEASTITSTHRLASVKTNDTYSYSMPENAVRYPNWWIRGAWEDSFCLDFSSNFVFPYGSNRLTSVEVFSQGYLRPVTSVIPYSPSVSSLASIGVHVSLIPGFSSFLYEHTSSNSYRFIWDNVHSGRYVLGCAQPQEINNFSLELFRNGNVQIVSNDITRLIPYVCPGDGDGDGIPNEKDAYPTLPDGDNFGPPDEMPADANDEAYCTIDLVSPDVVTEVRISGDGISNLPDPHFIALPAVTNRVTILIGKTYRIESAFPLLCVGVSDPKTVVTTNPDDSLTIVRPVTFIREESQIRTSGGFRMIVDPPGLGGVFQWSSNACCAVTGAGQLFSVACEGCGCNGCSLGGKYVYEGYQLSFGDIECGCVPQDPPCPASTLLLNAYPPVVFKDKKKVTFDKSILVCQTDVDRSGTFELTMSGDTCAVREQNGSNCPNGFTWRVDGPGMQEKIFYVTRSERSTSFNGSIFTVTFTPDDGSEGMQSTIRVVFSEFETKTVAHWPADRTRRTIGVCEEVDIYVDPPPIGLILSSELPSSRFLRYGSCKWRYFAPEKAGEEFISANGYGQLFSLKVQAPVSYSAKPNEISYTSTPGISGSMRVRFDLTLQPTNVSFSGIQIVEKGMIANNYTGYFCDPINVRYLTHGGNQGADVWSDVCVENKGVDSAQCAQFLPPWGAGGMLLWPIPNNYRRMTTDSDGQYFVNTDQLFELSSSGTVRMSKFGWEISVTTNREINYQKENK